MQTRPKIETGDQGGIRRFAEDESVQYILFEQYPQVQDIANANIIHEDDYMGVMDWLQRVD